MIFSDINLKQAFTPSDLNTAAIVGARVGFQGCEKIAIVIHLGVSLTGGVVDVTLKQHDAATAGTSKVIAIANPYFHKAGAATSFTKVVPVAAASNFVASTIFDIDGGFLVFEINADQLDCENDFSYISAELADGGVAKIASAVYILADNSIKPAYENAI